jgi:glycosyltransferase involved in cell wall biosynthesis
MTPLISVIIPTYNSAKYLPETLESVLKQTFKDFEIIVVDDGSSDHTPDVIKPYLDRVKYVQKSNGGPASARNLGLTHAKGEFVAFLDADDIWNSKKLEQQIKIMQSMPEVGIVHTGVQVIDADGQEVLLNHKDRKDSKTYSFMDLFNKNKIATSSVLVRAECFKKVGAFDENPEIISLEDYDLWLRIAAQYKIYFLAEPLLEYRIHNQGISQNIQRSYRAEEKVVLDNAKRFNQKFPYIRKILSKRLSQIYYECGADYFYANEYALSREQFKKALKTTRLN